jgi:hypothetical protein
MKRPGAVLLFVAAMAPAFGQETVVTVDINYFAAARHARGVSTAQRDQAAGTPRYFVHFPDLFWSRPTPAEEKRLMLRHDTTLAVLRGAGIEPETTGSGCVPNPGADAYVKGYNEAMENFMVAKFGKDYRSAIDAEVERRIAAKGSKKRL